MAVHSEQEVLEELCTFPAGRGIHDSLEELELHTFCVYRAITHPKRFEGQYENLANITSNPDCFNFDGILQDREEHRYVIDIPIKTISIGGLDDPEIHTAKRSIWLLSTHNDATPNPCWYRAQFPVSEYSQHWQDFLWVADLAKHTIDYLCHQIRNENDVTLEDFAMNFWTTICKWHQDDADFLDWHRQCGYLTDFRIHLVRHSVFLHDQASNMVTHNNIGQLRRQPLWDQLCVGSVSYNLSHRAAKEKTVVTPSIASAFLKTCPSWAGSELDLLDIVEMEKEVERRWNERRQLLQFPHKNGFSQTEHFKFYPDQGYFSKAALLLENAAFQKSNPRVAPERLLGKAVIVRSQDHLGNRDILEYAIVKEIIRHKLQVIWLVLPSQTICGSDLDGSFYPIGNELFYSDKCNCELIDLDRVVAHFGITEFSDHAGKGAELFVQLAYAAEEAAVKTITTSELLCKCQHTDSMAVSKVRSRNQKNNTIKSNDPTHNQSLANDHNVAKLRNLSLFSGCGMLDHGLEECGLIQTIFAIDQSETAIRSHEANSISSACRHVIGSVNDYLRRFLTGEEAIFDTDCMSAGCPCQGFTQFNGFKSGIKSQRNCTLLASTLSWIELFLPAYVIIENVPGMDYVSSTHGNKNACAQAISCLVALGYQVKKVFRKIPEATEFGAPTSRKRLFLFAAAPGYVLPKTPSASHGQGMNGLHETMKVRDVIRDLEPLTNDTLMNIQRPDHIPLTRFKYESKKNVNFRHLVQRIPKTPRALGINDAYHQNLLSVSQVEWWQGLSTERRGERSRYLSRVDPNKPFGTIVTRICPENARHGGRCLHPYEDRVFSFLEYRRAQGIPDSFIVVGKLEQQLHQIGNGVVWQVASALGNCLGQAWKESVIKGAPGAPPMNSMQCPMDQLDRDTHCGVMTSTTKFDCVDLSNNRRTVTTNKLARFESLDCVDGSGREGRDKKEKNDGPGRSRRRRTLAASVRAIDESRATRNGGVTEKRVTVDQDSGSDVVILETQSVRKKPRMK